MKKYFLFISVLVISIAEANTGPITPAEIDQMMNDPEGFKITQAINKLSYDAKQKELAKKSGENWMTLAIEFVEGGSGEVSQACGACAPSKTRSLAANGCTLSPTRRKPLPCSIQVSSIC